MTSQVAITLLKSLEQSLDSYCELNDEGKTAFRMAISALELFGNSEQLPSTQPRKGKWIRTRTMIHDGELYCDQCDQEHPEQKKIWNFCPNCGASMKVGDVE